MATLFIFDYYGCMITEMTKNLLTAQNVDIISRLKGKKR
jgi:hypothetical protein